MYQRFKVGDKVKARGFTDCFGKWSEEVDGLTVHSVQYIDNKYAPHWRCKAVYADGYRYIEGNQEHFVLREVSHD